MAALLWVGLRPVCLPHHRQNSRAAGEPEGLAWQQMTLLLLPLVISLLSRQEAQLEFRPRAYSKHYLL